MPRKSAATKAAEAEAGAVTDTAATTAKKARKAAVDAQFAEADAKGDPSAEKLEELRVGTQVRGY